MSGKFPTISAVFQGLDFRSNRTHIDQQ